MSLISTARQWASSLNRILTRPTHKKLTGWTRQTKFRICRNETTNPAQHRLLCNKPGESVFPSAGARLHRPSQFDKKVLVYNRTYPSVEAVPKEVTHAQMLRAKDWFRIRVNIGAIFLTIFACIIMAYFGKKAAREGKSVTQMNLEMHRKFQEDSKNKGS